MFTFVYNQESMLSAAIIGLKQNLTVKKKSKEVVKNNFTTNK